MRIFTVIKQNTGKSQVRDKHKTYTVRWRTVLINPLFISLSRRKKHKGSCWNCSWNSVVMKDFLVRSFLSLVCCCCYKYCDTEYIPDRVFSGTAPRGPRKEEDEDRSLKTLEAASLLLLLCESLCQFAGKGKG